MDATEHRARLGDRSLFPDLAARAYLNHAAISPPSVAVREAVDAVMADYSARGVGAVGTWMSQRDGLRERLARLVGASADQIALLPNTTRGVTDVALCFPWRSGDRVVVFEGEFPANVTPWQRAAELFDLRIVWVPLAPFAEGHSRGLERFRDALAGGVRLVAVSAVQFQTGMRMPVEDMGRLCREHGAQLFVDGIQAVGAVPVDVERAGVDYLTAGGQKWLMGLEGTGMLYVRRERAAELRPHVAGWLSHEDGLGFLFQGPGHLRYDRPLKRNASVFEGGGYNAAGFAALEASVRLIEQLGVEAIHTHVNRYHDALERELVARGFRSLRSPEPAARSCTLGVTPPEGVDVVELQRELGSRGIAASIPDGVLRFAPHWPNALDEVPVVTAALDDAVAALR